MATVLHWRGDEIKRKMERAAKIGIDETTAACVNEAKANHPYQNVTGTAERSVQMRPAQKEGSRIVGRWGSFTCNYFLWLEIMTAHSPAMPSLRPAADKEYPHLKRRIKEAFQRA